jgi:hypothetical protein
MSKNVIFVSVLIFLLVAGIFYWTSIRPSKIRAFCYKEVYEVVRVNEENYEWAAGKGWLPKPGHEVTDSEPYVWIYVDQSDTTWMGEEANKKRQVQQNKNYESCLMKSGI